MVHQEQNSQPTIGSKIELSSENFPFLQSEIKPSIATGMPRHLIKLDVQEFQPVFLQLAWSKSVLPESVDLHDHGKPDTGQVREALNDLGSLERFRHP